MPKEQLAKNILCADARVDGEKMRTCAFSEEEYDQVRSAGEMLRQAPLFVNDGGALTPPALRAQCRRLRHREKLGLVVVDYLQLMRSARRSDSREQEVAEISRELKGVARELNIPVIAVSQLNRAPEGRSDKRPQLSDLRESGALEQDADVVILLYREEYYERGEGEVPLEAQNVAEVIIAKNRNGRVGTVKFTFFKEFLRFEAHSPAVPAGGYA
jgi:replicative DNA helicase